MIQRIQTLYLFLATVVVAFMIFFPMGWVVAGGEEYRLTAFGLDGVRAGGEEFRAASTMSLGVVIAVAAALPFLSIFLFRNRKLQLRVCMIEFAVLLGAQVLALLFLHKLAVIFVDGYEIEAAASFGVPMFFPLVAVVLNWLAVRGIRKDINLVKSLDRIR